MVPNRPRARQGLVINDHSRRGRRVITVLDSDTLDITVLEPWEHAVLVLCDGTRDTDEIATLVSGTVDVTLDARHIRGCLELFLRENIIERDGSPARSASMSARTLAELQIAYQEWHKDPVRTRQILLGQEDEQPAPPVDEAPAHRPGSVLVAAEAVLASTTEEMEAAPKHLLDEEPTFDGRNPLPRPADPEQTDVNTPMPLPHSAAAVFARLRRAGVVARLDPEARDKRGEGRRKNTASSAVFESGLELLMAGDLEFALDHFEKLAARMPGSARVTAFVRAIEAVSRQPAFDSEPIDDPQRAARAGRLLDTFEAAIADAVARGQCPSCFAAVQPVDELCPRCRFVLKPE